MKVHALLQAGRRVALIAAFALSQCEPALAQRDPAPASMPAPGRDVEYVARPGDTMIGIARRLLADGKRWEVQRALQQHNKLRDADRIAPGLVVLIPENWILNEAARIEIVKLDGEVQSKGAALSAGGTVAAGEQLSTGKGGTVTIRLADGSTLALQPESSLSIERVTKTPLAPAPEAVFQLIKGRVETKVEKRAASGARFEVRTPVAVGAVRGTVFRVAMDEAKGSSTAEVLEGTVQVTDTGERGSVSVEEGFGTRTIAGNAPAAPRALLAAPRLWGGVRLVWRAPENIRFVRLQGAVSYRMRIARSADASDVVAETMLSREELSINGLADGTYYVRVRGIDELGLEGRDATAQMLVRIQAPASPPPAEPSGRRP